MASLTQAYEAYERPGIVVAYKMSNVNLYKGALVGVNASGYAVRMDPASASLKFVGVANETVDNSAGNAGDKSISVTKTGSFIFKPGGTFSPVQADLGKEVYAVSDWEVHTSSSGLTNAYKVGTIVALEPSSTGTVGPRIRVDNYSL